MNVYLSVFLLTFVVIIIVYLIRSWDDHKVCALCDSEKDVVFDDDMEENLCQDCIKDLSSGEQR